MASKHMMRSWNHTKAIEAQVKAAKKPQAHEEIQTQIAPDILAMDNDTLATALTHARRSCKVMPDRQRQLQAEWRKRLAALDDA